MTIRSLAFALAALFAVGILADAALAQSAQSETRASHSTHKPHAHKRVARQTPDFGKIACTHVGCIPISSKCTTTIEEGWDGPTGYEIVNCP